MALYSCVVFPLRVSLPQLSDKEQEEFQIDEALSRAQSALSEASELEVRAHGLCGGTDMAYGADGPPQAYGVCFLHARGMQYPGLTKHTVHMGLPGTGTGAGRSGDAQAEAGIVLRRPSAMSVTDVWDSISRHRPTQALCDRRRRQRTRGRALGSICPLVLRIRYAVSGANKRNAAARLDRAKLEADIEELDAKISQVSRGALGKGVEIEGCAAKRGNQGERSEGEKGEGRGAGGAKGWREGEEILSAGFEPHPVSYTHLRAHETEADL
eukprot:1832896-Rhodomonas_salina.1